jgi:hypothetical protein
LQALIRSGSSLNYFASQLLSLCSNQPADVVVIDYDCVPNQGLPWIKTYDVCSVQTISDNSAILTTPNFPSLQANKDCAVTVSTNSNNNKLLRVFAVSTELQTILTDDE